MDAPTSERIARTLDESPQTRWSPMAVSVSIRLTDNRVTSLRRALRNTSGSASPTFPRSPSSISRRPEHTSDPVRSSADWYQLWYAVLEPTGTSQAWARLGEETVGVRCADGGFTWLGLTLSAGFGEVGASELVLGLTEEAGIKAPVRVEADKVVHVVRPSRLGGWLIFLLNLDREAVEARVESSWDLQNAEDLFSRRPMPVNNGYSFDIRIDRKRRNRRGRDRSRTPVPRAGSRVGEWCQAQSGTFPGGDYRKPTLPSSTRHQPPKRYRLLPMTAYPSVVRCINGCGRPSSNQGRQRNETS